MIDLLRDLRQSPLWTGLHTNARHVALTLAIHTKGNSRITSMGLEGLARHTGLSPAVAGRSVKELLRAGVITRTRSPGGPIVTTFVVARAERSSAAPAAGPGTGSA